MNPRLKIRLLLTMGYGNKMSSWLNEFLSNVIKRKMIEEEAFYKALEGRAF